MSVCVLAADGFCSGCLRTLDEIARWAVMSADDQWQVIERLERRLAQRNGQLPLQR
jgi:predicted Fe-S protein YdhL (DUF1289 family)